MIIVVANHKGGVGKTAIAAHLVFRAAELGLRVLGIDLDAQANLTGTFVSRDATLGRQAADAIFADTDGPLVPMETDFAGISILPASDSLNGVDGGGLHKVFEARERLRTLAESFDLVVVDNPPALGLRLESSLAAGDALVVPLIPEHYSVQGVASLLRRVASIRANINPALQQPQFVWNLVSPLAGQHKEVMAAVGSQFPALHEPIHRAIAVADALADRRPVWRNTTNSGAGAAWKKLVDNILGQSGVRV